MIFLANNFVQTCTQSYVICRLCFAIIIFTVIFYMISMIFSFHTNILAILFHSSSIFDSWIFFSFTAHKYSHNHSNTHQFTYKTNKCGRHRSHKGYWIDLKTHFDTQFDNFIFQWNTFYNFSRYVFDDHRVRSKKNSAVKSNETAKIWRWRACQLIPPYCYCYICSDNSVRMTDVKLPSDYWIFEILPVWQFFWNYFTFRMW